MAWLIQALGVPGIADELIGAPRYLSAFDPEAHEGRGLVTFTTNPNEAIRYETTTAALEAWRSESRTVPLRPDGKPNRPMTAFTIELVDTERLPPQH